MKAIVLHFEFPRSSVFEAVVELKESVKVRYDISNFIILLICSHVVQSNKQFSFSEWA